jgi:protein-S-isoprenylcysteine O-methyltransferase Ste14
MDKNPLIKFLIKSGEKQFSTRYKIFTLAWGITLFIVLLPFLLTYLSSIFSGYLAIDWPRKMEIIVTIFTVPLGLLFIFWTLVLQVKIGQGTPAPMVPPKKLIITGPFKLCRNPMQLGVLFYYLGIGAYFSSLTAGIIGVSIYFLFSIPYHKLIEEKELELRFGKDYINYKKTTPFLFPKLNKK